MGKYFNDNFMHAKHCPRRGREDLRQELLERRRRTTDVNVEESPENPAGTGVLKLKNLAGGRPKLDIPLPEVLRMLSEGKSKSFISRAMGVHRRSIDRAIEDSPTALKIWGMRRGKGGSNLS